MSLLARLEPVCSALPAQLGLCLLDLEGGGRLELSAHREFPAASVVKVLIMLELFRQAGDGSLSLDQTLAVTASEKVGGAGVLHGLVADPELSLRDLCYLMIVVSDNVASNLLLKRVGMEAVNGLAARLGMPQTRLGRYFMEPPTGERDNRTSAGDMIRMLQALYSGEVIGGALRELALAIMRDQQFREMIPARLPEALSIAHKTGELDGVRHDVGIVELPGRPYALALLTGQASPVWKTLEGLAELSRLCYEYLEQDGSI